MARRKSNLHVVDTNNNNEENTKATVRQLKVKIDDLITTDPYTNNQKLFFKNYADTNAFLLHGSAGTGKTFIAMYKALEEVLDMGNPYNKVIICRSAVASRDIGHLPGDQQEKTEVYMRPYIDMCEELFPGKSQPFQRLLEQKNMEWMITSFVRGITLDNAIIIVDECQNMNDMEINSIMTRMGSKSKIIFCGDFRQSDLYKNRSDMSGLQKFMVIAEMMKSFKIVEFQTEDIVRSEMVKEYIIARQQYEEQYQ